MLWILFHSCFALFHPFAAVNTIKKSFHFFMVFFDFFHSFLQFFVTTCYACISLLSVLIHLSGPFIYILSLIFPFPMHTISFPFQFLVKHLNIICQIAVDSLKTYFSYSFLRFYKKYYRPSHKVYRVCNWDYNKNSIKI